MKQKWGKHFISTVNKHAKVGEKEQKQLENDSKVGKRDFETTLGESLRKRAFYWGGSGGVLPRTTLYMLWRRMYRFKACKNPQIQVVCTWGFVVYQISSRISATLVLVLRCSHPPLPSKTSCQSCCHPRLTRGTKL